MPIDPVHAAEVRSWLEKAAIDLRGAQIDLAAEPPLLEDALFHCQQAVEKSLKAFLAFHDVPFRKTHSIEEIGQACLSIDSSLGTLVDLAVPLTEYAWLYRYPGPTPKPERKEAETAMGVATDVYSAMCERMPEAARPG